MTEPGKPDRWNSLLETLGVPASETKPAAESAPTESRPEAPPAPAAKALPLSMLRPEKAKAAPKPPPAKSPSYWSRIAGALGLEVASEPEPGPPEVPQAKAPAQTMPERESPPQ